MITVMQGTRGIARTILKKHRRPIVITVAVVVLQVLFGFDPKFCIINFLWLLL